MGRVSWRVLTDNTKTNSRALSAWGQPGKPSNKTRSPQPGLPPALSAGQARIGNLSENLIHKSETKNKTSDFTFHI